jgi:hypothetical protein
MEEPTPSRHRRRERRRNRTAQAPPDPAAGIAADPTAETVTRAPADTTAETATETPAKASPETAAGNAAGTAAETTAGSPAGSAAEASAETTAEVPGPAPKRKSRSRRTDAERSLRGIVGAGSSQVGVVGAMRARDAARPTAEELAAAERDLVIIRRHYVPPGTLPGAR